MLTPGPRSLPPTMSSKMATALVVSGVLHALPFAPYAGWWTEDDAPPVAVTLTSQGAPSVTVALRLPAGDSVTSPVILPRVDPVSVAPSEAPAPLVRNLATSPAVSPQRPGPASVHDLRASAALAARSPAPEPCRSAPPTPDPRRAEFSQATADRWVAAATPTSKTEAPPPPSVPADDGKTPSGQGKEPVQVAAVVSSPDAPAVDRAPLAARATDPQARGAVSHRTTRLDLAPRPTWGGGADPAGIRDQGRLARPALPQIVASASTRGPWSRVHAVEGPRFESAAYGERSPANEAPEDSERRLALQAIRDKVAKIAPLLISRRDRDDVAKAVIVVRLSARGYIDEVRVGRSSGNKAHDTAATEVIHLAEPFPYVPGDLELTVAAP